MGEDQLKIIKCCVALKKEESVPPPKCEYDTTNELSY